MNTATHDSKAETIFGITMVTTAGGVLTYALFPFMLPGIVLVAILALPLLPVVVVGAVLYGVFALVRGVGRLARRARNRSSADRRAGSASRPAPTTGRLGHST